MRRTMIASLLLGLLSLGSLAIAGDTQNAADNCPPGCCGACSGCCSTSCEIGD